MRHPCSIPLLTALALLAAACGESTRPEYVITAVGGDRQADSLGRPLAPLEVLVTDGNGDPHAGMAVLWSVVLGSTGGTAVTPAVSRTDARGVASTVVTLGSGQGLQQVRALTGGAQVLFNLFAFGPDLLLTSVFFIPFSYIVHDTFVRDGIAFVCAGDNGVLIYDVGNGVRDGTPWLPVPVGELAPQGWGLAHNAWWFHNPNTSERRYLFVGEEGPSTFGVASSGDIHVLDVSDLSNPVDVATFRVPGAGPHNFWMDESAEILYTAYYNAGVLAIDVSGVLSGDLATRQLSLFLPTDGEGKAFTWAVQLAGNGWLYAIDMLSGLWQLAPGPPLAPQAGGSNVLERYSSALWVHGDYAYTGTWGFRAPPGNAGNAMKIWHLDAGGAPALVDSLVLPGVSTVSDVEVSPDGKLLMLGAEGGFGSGVYWYDLTDPVKPAFQAQSAWGDVHAATFAAIGGRLYTFAVRDPLGPALVIYNVTRLLPP